MRIWNVLVACLSFGLLLSTMSGSEESPYVGLEQRAIKSLSADQIASLRQGEGMGFAMAAELNGYPGPKHVLEMGEEIGLTPLQREEAQLVFDRMRASAIELGEAIVAGEAELDRLFSSGTIDGRMLSEQVASIAALQGELRTVHLAAHLEIADLLTAQQVESYVRGRGYHSGTTEKHSHEHGNHGR